MAFTLIMCAYSLRTWRRNGVACDELLFLPGTPHEQTHGVESSPVTATSDRANAPTRSATRSANRSEGDVAAGVGWQVNTYAANADASPSATALSPLGVNETGGLTISGSPKRSKRDRSKGAIKRDGAITLKRAVSMDSSSQDNEFANSWDERSDVEEDAALRVSLVAAAASRESNINRSQQDRNSCWDEYDEYDNTDDEEEELRVPLAPASPRENGDRARLHRDDSDLDEQSLHSINNRTALEIDGGVENNEGSPAPVREGLMRRFREEHPRITMLGSFFFFRSSTTSTHSAAYAPSGPSVVGAALDLSMPVLFNYHLYIEAYNHINTYGSDTPAKILPLIFMSALIVRSVMPPGRRWRFWSTMKITIMAPFHRIRFRDAFVGDILTSLVRPLQDILFALSYYVTVVSAVITGHHSLSECGQILESSWILHNVVLPSCALLPLWWRFLQTLRECYDTGKRWPALGNAFKYLTASLVILYGMTHPEDRRSPWWLVSYALTCLYQIWWDTMVDWELFVFPPRPDEMMDCESLTCSQAISSLSPNSYVLLILQRNIFQPIRVVFRCISNRFRFMSHIQLRPTRLYKNDSFYWRIFCYNTIFRFTWMLCFIPAYHLSPSGGEHVTTFSSDTNSFLGVLLPVAELLRRTLWGFLLLEKETIRIMNEDPIYSRQNSRDLDSSRSNSRAVIVEESEALIDSMDSSKSARPYLPTWLGTQHQQQHEAATSSSRFQWCCACFQCDGEIRRKLLIIELSLWAVAFVGLGLWASGD
jgi:hypothetical protein